MRIKDLMDRTVEDRKRAVVIIVIFLLFIIFIIWSVIGVIRYMRERGDRGGEEALSVFWEYPAVGMNLGETRELRYISNREIQPEISCEGQSAVIVGTINDGVRVRAVESGVDVISLRIEGQETVCIITVNEDRFKFENEEAEVRVNEIKSIPVVAEPFEILERNPIYYWSYDSEIAVVREGGRAWVEIEGVNEGATYIIAEWRGKRAEILVKVNRGGGRVILTESLVRYINIGQETRVQVVLDEMTPGEEADFIYEAGFGRAIELTREGNTAIVRGKERGRQSVIVNHPLAEEGIEIVYDVSVPVQVGSPYIDVSHSPLVLRKDEVKRLEISVRNGSAANRTNFRWEVVENEYAISAAGEGNYIIVRGIMPGAAKIRIKNPDVKESYDVMVLVDDGLGHKI